MAKKGSKLVSITQDLNPFSVAEDFIMFKKCEGITPFTLSSFRSAFRQFFAEYKGSLREGVKLKRAVVLFLSDKKAGYHNKLLQALRQLFEYCVLEGICTENPTAGMRYKKENARIVEHSEKVIKTLLTLPDCSTFAGLRNYTFMLTMLDTGIRPNELLQITLNDINLEECQLFVREEYSKTRTLRVLPISQVVAKNVKKLILSRHCEWENDVPIFCSFSGNRLSSHNFQEQFKLYSERLGVVITPYHLRHVFALFFIRNGGSPFALQKILGHTKMETTLIYVRLAESDIRGNHTKASPLKSLFQPKKMRRNIDNSSGQKPI